MKLVLIYMSPNGTTQKIGNELSKLFLKDHHEVIELNLGEKENKEHTSIDLGIFKNADLVGIGSPVYHMKALEPLSDFLRYALPEIRSLNKSAKAFIYLTYGGATTGKAFINMAKLLHQNSIPVIGAFKVKAPHFWHTGNFPDAASIKTINDFYSAISGKDFREMEWNQVEKMFSRQKLLVSLLYPLSGAIGKLRVPKNIRFDYGKCIKCKKCFNECPVGAIEMSDYPVRNTDKCIYCYHCTTVCPKGAIVFNVDEAKKTVATNKKIIGLEYPENEIYR